MLVIERFQNYSIPFFKIIVRKMLNFIARSLTITILKTSAKILFLFVISSSFSNWLKTINEML